MIGVAKVLAFKWSSALAKPVN